MHHTVVNKANGSGSLTAGFMAVVLAIALPARKQHQEIRQQIGEGVQPVRNERLRPPEVAHDQLQQRQQQVDPDADPGAFLRSGKALCIGRFKDIARSVGVIFHVD